MADLSIATINRDGVDQAANLVAAAAGGDKVKNTGKEFLVFKNDDGTDTTITFVTVATVDAQAVDDRTLVVPAGKVVYAGPFSKDVYNDAVGDLSMTYSKVTSLTVGVFKPGVV